jgi:DNA-directed RNA polymerase specialized sigma24 family protein
MYRGKRGREAVNWDGWEGWEYGVLGGELPVIDVARVLGRAVEEVARKARSYREATLAGWYRRHRPWFAPADPTPLLELGGRILTKDFPEVLDEEGYTERLVVAALRDSFRYFDPARGKLDRSVQRRFLVYFRSVLRQRLTKESARLSKRRANTTWLRTAGDCTEYPGRASECEGVAEAYAFWSHQLYDLALRRLDPRTRAYVELKHSGRRVGEIAALFGVSAKTLSNTFGRARLVKRLQGEVRAVVLGLPEGRRRGLVAHFLHEVGLTPDQVVWG